MGEKKGKVLARELVDDLLKDDDLADGIELDAEEEPQQDVMIPKASADKAPTGGYAHGRSKPDLQQQDIDNDKTIDLAAANAHEQDAPIVRPGADPGSLPPPSAHGDATVPLPEDAREGPRVSHSEERSPRTSVGRHGALRSGVPNATEAALAQSESLRIAQNRIIELEQELERLRIQNEQLGAAGETLRRRADELINQSSKRESDYQNAVNTFEQEKEILLDSKDAISRDLELARRKHEELELRISSNIQKIRVRERELENRLELVKMESAALIRNKDEIILESKRQIDQLNLELTNYRNKNQELNRVTSDKQEMLRRTVKALRLALSMLEGEEEAPRAATPMKKAK